VRELAGRSEVFGRPQIAKNAERFAIPAGEAALSEGRPHNTLRSAKKADLRGYATIQIGPSNTDLASEFPPDDTP